MPLRAFLRGREGKLLEDLLAKASEVRLTAWPLQPLWHEDATLRLIPSSNNLMIELRRTLAAANLVRKGWAQHPDPKIGVPSWGAGPKQALSDFTGICSGNQVGIIRDVMTLGL